MATGYGTTMWAGEYLVTGRLARGASVVAQSAVRRQTTPRGTLYGGDEEAAFGIDLSSFVGSSDPAKIAAMLPSVIRTELVKDERISDATVTVTYTVDTSGMATFVVTERIQTYESAESFTLTLEVSAVSASVVGLS